MNKRKRTDKSSRTKTVPFSPSCAGLGRRRATRWATARPWLLVTACSCPADWAPNLARFPALGRRGDGGRDGKTRTTLSRHVAIGGRETYCVPYAVPCLYCTRYSVPCRSAFSGAITRCDGRLRGVCLRSRVTVASASSADTDTTQRSHQKKRDLLVSSHALLCDCTNGWQSRSLTAEPPSPDGQRDPLGSCCCWCPSGLGSSPVASMANAHLQRQTQHPG